MNRLKGLSAYLSGAIDFDPDMGRGWREDATPFLEQRNVHVFSPLKHIFYGTHDVDTTKRPRMKRLLENGEFHALRDEVKDLNHWDLRAVDLSSFLIVNYNVNIFTCGTHEEIFTANKQSKPVLIMTAQGKTQMPKWMYGRFPPEHMFESWEELYAYIEAIDTDPNYSFTEADKKRWLFFDGPHMYEDEK